MVIVKINGGLGNQMFQYALGRKLSLKLGSELALDLSGYDAENAASSDGRPYMLGYFNIVARPATSDEIRAIGYPHGIFLKKVQRKIEHTILGRNHSKFDPTVLEKKGDVYLEGFWQSEKYFKDIRATLLKDFSLKNSLSPEAQTIAENIRKEPQSISIHVRRGDYVANEKNIRRYGNHCGPEYYKKALAKIAENSSINGATLDISKFHAFIFSDDIAWAKNNLDLPCQKTYSIPTAASDAEQIFLMSLCRAHIIANSTFGWWGAWLDEKPDKIVVAPSMWTPGIDLPIDDIVPPEWIKIGYI